MIRRSHEAPARPPSRNEKIVRRFVPETYIAIVSNAARTAPGTPRNKNKICAYDASPRAAGRVGRWASFTRQP